MKIKGLMEWSVFILFLIVCIQAVSAISVTSISIDPSGSLTPSTPVTVSFKIENPGVFPADSELQLFTDLNNPKWTYVIVVNGKENLRPVMGGQILTISGFELNYGATDVVSVRVTLEGVAPAVIQTSSKTMIRVTEYDSNGRPVTSTQVERTTLVVNTGNVASAIASHQADLQVYREHIDEKAALSIDTSAAEVKYNEASQKLNSARSRPSNEYIGALQDLSDSTAIIAAGESALDKAWAESEVTSAQVPINNVDSIIVWFKSNPSTANDQQLPAIIAKRETAFGYLSNANDDIAQGNYALARGKARDAFTKANEAYTDALARQKQLLSRTSVPIPKTTIVPTISFVTPSTTTHTIITIPSLTPTPDYDAKIAALESQLAEQNKKIEQQGNILDQIMNFLRNVLGWK
jgi:hypothetical protein